MFLEKYKNLRRLGKGAFGSVYLVEDAQGVWFALKIIPTKRMKQQPHLRDYLLGEIRCLKEMSSANVIKLCGVEEDDHSIYLLLEYCDGGDLTNYQANLPEKVFSVDLATVVLTEVIIGLGDLHRQGYVHRDIKLQNVLIKNQNGRVVYKLADFGFSKKIEDIGGTILGTENFMSPEIYSGSEAYGFEVDMWAFGVLFFFMLNLEYPFEVHPRLPPEFKRVALGKLASGFSYLKAVKKTRKQLLHNCTDDMQDLFKRIFEVDPDNRLTFSQIRQHPVFLKHFLTVAESCKALYKVKCRAGPQLRLTKLTTIKQSQDYLEMSLRVTIQSEKYTEQKQILHRRRSEIDFLRYNVFEFLEAGGVLKTYEKLMLTFHLLKYYIVILRVFRSGLNPIDLSVAFPGLKWGEYLNTMHFKLFVKETAEDLRQNELKFMSLYDHCEVFIEEITASNPLFAETFQKDIVETSFVGVFKQSYRKSTIHVFGVLLQASKSRPVKKGNRISYMLAQLVVCHAFNNLFANADNLALIFKQYLQLKGRGVEQMDYLQLREWMGKSTECELNRITKRIIKIFFTS